MDSSDKNNKNEERNGLSRRSFLGGAMASSAIVGLTSNAAAMGVLPPHIEQAQVRLTPRAVAMWEFSWLTRRSGDEAEYADIGKALDDCESFHISPLARVPYQYC